MSAERTLQEVLNSILEFKDENSVQSESGGYLLTRRPDMGTEAFLHRVYPPLTKTWLDELEAVFPFGLPRGYRLFLTMSNGLDLFCRRMAIYGSGYVTLRIGTHNFQPLCVEFPNTLERPRRLADEFLIVGSYGGVEIFKIAESVETGEVIRFRAKDCIPLNRWPSFPIFLATEFDRLAKLYKTNCGKIDPRPCRTLYASDSCD